MNSNLAACILVAVLAPQPQSGREGKGGHQQPSDTFAVAVATATSVAQWLHRSHDRPLNIMVAVGPALSRAVADTFQTVLCSSVPDLLADSGPAHSRTIKLLKIQFSATQAVATVVQSGTSAGARLWIWEDSVSYTYRRRGREWHEQSATLVAALNGEIISPSARTFGRTTCGG
jgi:hypothetical protein